MSRAYRQHLEDQFAVLGEQEVSAKAGGELPDLQQRPKSCPVQHAVKDVFFGILFVCEGLSRYNLVIVYEH